MLAAEVVSPESGLRDRERKPQLYAPAGIPHFRLDEDGERQALRDRPRARPGHRAPRVTGVHHDRLKLSDPFPIDVTALSRS